MESKWRLTPWELGYHHGLARLAAEILWLPGYYICDMPDQPDRYQAIYLDYAYWQPWFSGGVFLKSPTHPHFPYGWEVVPDNP